MSKLELVIALKSNAGNWTKKKKKKKKKSKNLQVILLCNEPTETAKKLVEQKSIEVLHVSYRNLKNET
jgi:hypothetical protein